VNRSVLRTGKFSEKISSVTVCLPCELVLNCNRIRGVEFDLKAELPRSVVDLLPDFLLIAQPELTKININQDACLNARVLTFQNI